jgi:hypothetical protein
MPPGSLAWQPLAAVGWPSGGRCYLVWAGSPRASERALAAALPPAQMVYGRAAVFGGAAHAPTFGRLYEAFGPTYPGEAEAEGVVALQYPGVLFLFPVAPPQQPGHALPAGGPGGYGGPEGMGKAATSFPVPLNVVAERIYIHAGVRGEAPRALIASALKEPHKKPHAKRPGRCRISGTAVLEGIKTATKEPY